MIWSPEQERALTAVRAWLRDKNAPQTFYLAGFAGSGKTSLAKEMAAGVKKAVLYGAFTGKAALVLQRKGCRGASTIHSMIYSFEQDQYGLVHFRLNPESPVADAGLVIIDEVSMVSEELAADLLSFGTRVLVIGDPAQLPPVRGTGYFTSRKPDVMLTEVHRQAQENPIIRMSMDIREGRQLEPGAYGDSKVIRISQVNREEVLAADQVLVGINRSRRLYNARMRDLKGFTDPNPEVGERLVCLRNNRKKSLLNGGLWTVAERGYSNKWAVDMIVEPDDAGLARRAVEVSVHPHFFCGRDGELSHEELRTSDHFDFGYALTVHKSQGSQWDSVYLFDESSAFREDRQKWLYTAVTRAAETVTIVAT